MERPYGTYTVQIFYREVEIGGGGEPAELKALDD